MKIARHTIDSELAQEGAERKGKLLRIMLESPGESDAGLSTVMSTAKLYAGYLAVDNGDVAELCRALRIGAQASAAIFVLATAIAPIEIELDGRKLTLQPTGTTSSTHIGNWRVGWWLAHIVCDSASIAKLASVPIEVLRNSTSRADSCQYLFAEALQGFHHRTDNWQDKLQAAIDATDPDNLSLLDEDFVLNILVPEMQMLFRFTTGEIAPFDEALKFAIERHKKYWSAGVRKKDPTGFLSLGPLAISSMAVAAGMPIEFESEYVPLNLMDNACGKK